MFLSQPDHILIMASWNIKLSSSWNQNTRVLHITLQKNEPFPTNKVRFLECQRSTFKQSWEEGRLCPLRSLKSSGKLDQQFKFVLIAKMVDGQREVSWEMVLKLSMIFIVSLQWHSQIMTLCYYTHNARSSFSSGNNCSIIFCLPSTSSPLPMGATGCGRFGAGLRKVSDFLLFLKAMPRRHILTQKWL